MARMRGTLNEVEQVAKENANVESRRLRGSLVIGWGRSPTYMQNRIDTE